MKFFSLKLVSKIKFCHWFCLNSQHCFVKLGIISVWQQILFNVCVWACNPNYCYSRTHMHVVGSKGHYNNLVIFVWVPIHGKPWWLVYVTWMPSAGGSQYCSKGLRCIHFYPFWDLGELSQDVIMSLWLIFKHETLGFGVMNIFRNRTIPNTPRDGHGRHLTFHQNQMMYLQSLFCQGI